MGVMYFDWDYNVKSRPIRWNCLGLVKKVLCDCKNVHELSEFFICTQSLYNYTNIDQIVF